MELRFCPYINDGNEFCKIEIPKCLVAYESCHQWYIQNKPFEEEPLFIGGADLGIIARLEEINRGGLNEK